jgi:hypothetical protein
MADSSASSGKDAAAAPQAEGLSPLAILQSAQGVESACPTLSSTHARNSHIAGSLGPGPCFHCALASPPH